jgi:hypothetical protein
MTTTQNIRKYNEAQAEVKRLWALMCHADGVDLTSKFVVFANNNPYAFAYNEAVTAFQQIRKQIKRNETRRERHATMVSMGLQRVKGSLGGTYYE